MNTVTKQLFLIFGLCFIVVGITQPGERKSERKRAESASDLLGLPRVESVESLGTVDPEDEGSVDIHDYSEEGLNDEARLTKREKEELKANLSKGPVIMFGAQLAADEEPSRLKEPKKVKPPFKKPSILQKCLGCCRRPAKQ